MYTVESQVKVLKEIGTITELVCMKGSLGIECVLLDSLKLFAVHLISLSTYSSFICLALGLCHWSVPR